MEEQNLAIDKLKPFFHSDLSKSILDIIDYKKIDIEVKDGDGKIIHNIKQASFPVNWSYNTCRIVATKYFSRYKDKEENSAKAMVDRITTRIKEYSINDKYLTSNDAKIFKSELDYLLINQMMSFNSPVWFNMGNYPIGEEQLSACFCLKQEDSMESLLKVQTECVNIYKQGSGTGQLNRARSSKDILTGGGHPSGPLDFISARDGWAKSTKSGGITRRAAAMELIDCDHADVFEFIRAKAIEEEKAFKSDIYEKNFQNSNFTVRLSKKFWEKYKEKKEIKCYGTKGHMLLAYYPDDLLTETANGTWTSADPGLQFLDIIEKWSKYDCEEVTLICNPCAEYIGVEDSSCDLASLNVAKFINYNGTIKEKELKQAVFLTIQAMDLIVHNGKYPTDAIKLNSIKYRPLGLGYCNMGATLMELCIPYDSEEGRLFAAKFTALMNYYAMQASALLAKKHGKAEGYNERLTLKYFDTLEQNHIYKKINIKYKDCLVNLHNETKTLVAKYGQRNVDTTALAPTGTIAFKMGADSTGCEPLTALEIYKHLAGEDTIKLEYSCVVKAKERLKKQNQKLSDIEFEKMVEDSPIFLTAFKNRKNGKALTPKAHIDMVAYLQPFVAMGISKTCNVPEETTPEEIKQLYIYAHEQGLKSITIYRDNSKSFQVLTTSSSNNNKEINGERIELPEDLPAIRHKVIIGGHKMRIIHCNFPGTNKVAEVFTKMTRDGSTLSGLLDAWIKTLSIALQHGVPFESFYKHLSNTIFEPKGFTSNPKIRGCTSIVDYIMKYLKMQMEDNPNTKEIINKNIIENKNNASYAPICFECGSLTIPTGTCYTCPNCGASSGCGG